MNMRKSAGPILCLSLLLLAVPAAQARPPRGWTPIQLALWKPVQLFSSERGVIGLELNLIYGEAFDLVGLDVGLVNRKQWMSGGIQLAGLFNRVVNRARGIQLAGVGNWVEGQSYGLQASIVNFAAGVVGIQLGVVNQNGPLSQVEPVTAGLQVGGLNIDAGTFSGIELGVVAFNERVQGIVVAAASSVTEEVRGLQLALLAGAKRLDGLQLGLVGILNPVLVPPLAHRGAQIGLCNVAGRFKGLQLGLVNYSTRITGLQIGLLNFNRGGRVRFLPVVNVGL